MKIIISAGGTGGHIMPAINIGEELIKQGHDILYIGNSNSMEERIVRKKNIKFFPINVQKLYRKITLKHLLFPYKLISSINKVKRIFKEFKPDAYLGCGGFVSGPAGYVARRNKIPYFLQEQNSYPGLTTRVLAKHANFVFIGQEHAKKYLKKSNIIYSGNPINMNIFSSTKLPELNTNNFDRNKKTIFLIGGSQGSQFLNNLIYSGIDEILEKFNLIWQIGNANFGHYKDLLIDKKGLYCFDFSYEINALYNITDLAICRAGAITIAELEAKHIPAIFIPLPSSAENHQYKNAQEQTSKKIAITLDQNNLDFNILLREIDSLVERFEYYKDNFGYSIHKNAVKVIVKSIHQSLNED